MSIKEFFALDIVEIAIVVLLIIFAVYLIRKTIKLFFDKTNFLDEKWEETLKQFANQVTKALGLVVFFFYILEKYFIGLGNLLTSSVVFVGALALIFQHIIRDYIMGLTYLFERQIHHGDHIIINSKIQGKVEEISLRHVKIRQHDGFLYTVSYSNITELQNGTRGMRRLTESLVLNYEQNPDDAFKVMEEVVQICNKKYRQYLLKDEHGIVMEIFTFSQITELNVDLKGHRYALTALVNEADFIEASKNVRYELVLAAFNHNLMMVDHSSL